MFRQIKKEQRLMHAISSNTGKLKQWPSFLMSFEYFSSNHTETNKKATPKFHMIAFFALVSTMKNGIFQCFCWPIIFFLPVSAISFVINCTKEYKS